VEIKIIDWDQSFRVDNKIPESLHSVRKDDPRFPDGRTASIDTHEFFINEIVKKLDPR
jgi:hypothetical protein